MMKYQKYSTEEKQKKQTPAITEERLLALAKFSHDEAVKRG